MTTTSSAPEIAAELFAATPQHRPAAHFTARETWLNDPNGLLFHDGVFHLFFQNNPDGGDWGNMSWGHATSSDLVTWDERPVAIPCTEQEQVFSGSAVVDEHNTAGFAGPGQTALVAIYTAAYTDGSPRAGLQAQALAYSLDAGATWARYEGNPVLDTGARDFRDPKVFRHGDRWVMAVVESLERRVAIYSSSNLREWMLESRFGPAHATEGIWECPDLFPLQVEGEGTTKWVLVVSLNPGSIAGGSGTQYFVGDFDGHTFTPDHLSSSDDPRSYDWLDYGRDYYAAVSFNGVPGGRRLMIGWASNWDYAHVSPTAPWRSAMSLVREVTLVRGADGRLRLRQLPVLPAAGLTVHRLTVPTDGAEVVLSGAGKARVTLRLDAAARTITCDRTRSGNTGFHPTFPSVDTGPLLGGPTTELLIVVDACVLEVYVDGGLTTFTELVFPHAPLTQVEVRTP